MSDDRTAAGQWAALWETYMHENRALRARAEAAEAEVERLRAELAQAQADRALMAGLWLTTMPPRARPALLPADQVDRDRLAAALDAVDLQPSWEARIAAGRAVVERVAADAKGGE